MIKRVVRAVAADNEHASSGRGGHLQAVRGGETWESWWVGPPYMVGDHYDDPEDDLQADTPVEGRRAPFTACATEEAAKHSGRTEFVGPICGFFS